MRSSNCTASYNFGGHGRFSLEKQHQTKNPQHFCERIERLCINADVPEEKASCRQRGTGGSRDERWWDSRSVLSVKPIVMSYSKRPTLATLRSRAYFTCMVCFSFLVYFTCFVHFTRLLYFTCLAHRTSFA